MKHLLFFLLITGFCVQATAQDSCRIKSIQINPATDLLQDGGSFARDVRLDNQASAGFDDNFIRKYKKQKLKFTNDYTGSLKNPGLLFSDIDFSGYDLLNAGLSFSDKNNVQRIVFSPFKLSDRVTSNFLQNVKIRLSQKSSVTTAGFGIGGDYSLKNVKTIAKDVFEKTINFYIPDCFNKKWEKELALQQNKDIADSLLFVFDSLRTKNVFKWSAGYSVQLFQFLSTKSDNPIADSLNYYGIKSNVFSIGGSYSHLNGMFQLTADYNYIHSRKSAERGQKKIAYHGVQFTASYRLISFLKGAKLKANADFIKSLFVPAIHLGISYENKKTNGEFKYVEDGVILGKVWTPYLDFLISPSSAFRIGIPIIRNRTITDVKTSQVAASLQYSFKLTNLN